MGTAGRCGGDRSRSNGSRGLEVLGCFDERIYIWYTVKDEDGVSVCVCVCVEYHMQRDASGAGERGCTHAKDRSPLLDLLYQPLHCVLQPIACLGRARLVMYECSDK